MRSTGPRSARDEPATRLSGTTRTGVFVAAALGLLVRLWLLGRQPYDESEIIPALMARDIVHGHFYAFYWGQAYGGVEPYLVAVMFKLFGESPFVLGLTPVLLNVIAALLIWRIGRRLFNSRVGVAASLLFWLYPAAYVSESTKEYGFRYVGLVCGLAALLLALRITHRPAVQRETTGETDSRDRNTTHRRANTITLVDWAALGLVAGVGWWASVESAFYLVPIAALLGWRAVTRTLDLTVGRVAVASVGVVVGAAPWLWVNAHTHLDSLRRVPPQPDRSYTNHIANFFSHALPTALGLRVNNGSSDWLFPDSGSAAMVIGVLVYLAIAVALVAWMITLFRRRDALVLVGAVALYPFAFALSPYAWDTHAARYGEPLSPLLALLIASGASAGLRRVVGDRWALRPVIAVATAVTLVAIVLVPYRPFPSETDQVGWLTWRANPNVGVVQLARSLEAAGVRRVWSSYWLSYELTWESDGRIVASDVRYQRHSPYFDAVLTASTAPWLFVEPGQERQAGTVLNLNPEHLNPGCLDRPGLCVDPESFEAFLTSLGIDYRVVRFDPMIAVEPLAPIPVTVIESLHRFTNSGYVATETIFSAAAELPR